MAATTGKGRVTVIRELGGRGSVVMVGNRGITSRFRLEWAPEDGTPDLVLHFEVRDGIPQCRSAVLRSTDEGREVLASDPRGVRLEDWLELAMGVAAMTVTVSGEGDEALVTFEPVETIEEARRTLTEVRGVRREARRRITDEYLREVARVYRENVADNPTAAVKRWSGKAHRTAALYVAQAREKGFLGPTTPGKAGEQQR